jgi:hypothetical protein
MSIQFPSRLGWLLILLITFLLLNSGCTPVQSPIRPPVQSPLQPPAQAASPLATEDEEQNATADASNEANPNPETTHIQESTSPNGEWFATAILTMTLGEAEYTQSLVVEHQSGLPSYTLVDGAYPSGLGYTVVTPFAWSEDNSRFYYTNRPQSDGCGLFNNSSDLYRVGLSTGETDEIVSPNTTTGMGLAPDEQYIAYLANGESTLIIRNLTTDDYVSVNIVPLLGPNRIDQLGSIVWSSDSQQFAFAVAHNPCSGGWAEATSIYLLDMNDMSVTALIEQDDRLLVPLAWSTPDQIQLQNDQGELFILELTTNTVTPQ